MAQVYPFRALRYNPDRVSFDRVLTQPYDKISPAAQERYYNSDPHNLIAVEKGRTFPADNAENNVYTRARAALQKWIAEGRADGRTQTRAEGASDWKLLSDFPEFAEALTFHHKRRPYEGGLSQRGLPDATAWPHDTLFP